MDLCIWSFWLLRTKANNLMLTFKSDLVILKYRNTKKPCKTLSNVAQENYYTNTSMLVKRFIVGR